MNDGFSKRAVGSSLTTTRPCGLAIALTLATVSQNVLPSATIHDSRTPSLVQAKRHHCALTPSHSPPCCHRNRPPICCPPAFCSAREPDTRPAGQHGAPGHHSQDTLAVIVRAIFECRKLGRVWPNSGRIRPSTGRGRRRGYEQRVSDTLASCARHTAPYRNDYTFGTMTKRPTEHLRPSHS